MDTIDKLLLNIVHNTSPSIEEVIPKRDSKILRSLATSVLGANFITENQGKLLIKILKEHNKILNLSEHNSLLDNPKWSQFFRPVDKTKKLFVSTSPDATPLISIEFAFNSQIRKTLSLHGKKIQGLIQTSPGKSYQAPLTEKNVVALVELLQPHGFEIDEKISNFYEIIKSWSEETVKNQFLLTTMTHTNFQKQITADLGISTAIDNNIIADRSLRYQYFVEKTEKNDKNLTEKIAFRETPRVWVDRKEYALSDVFESLKKLKRFPTMVVFDSHDSKKCVEELKNLAISLEKNEAAEDVGIYFRLANDEIGIEFNKLIASNSYNCQLDKDTKVVGVQNGKIPKFFLKNDWKPMSVITLGTSLRNSKTSVYASCCDLIISYTDQEPLVEQRVIWE